MVRTVLSVQSRPPPAAVRKSSAIAEQKGNASLQLQEQTMFRGQTIFLAAVICLANVFVIAVLLPDRSGQLSRRLLSRRLSNRSRFKTPM